MENNKQKATLVQEAKKLQDTFRDEYWSKKYDISLEELKNIGKNGISDLIIKTGIKHKAFSL